MGGGLAIVNIITIAVFLESFRQSEFRFLAEAPCQGAHS